MTINLKRFYSKEALVLRLKGLPPIKTTVINTFFARTVNHPFAKVGKSDISALGQAAPLIMRGGASLPVGRGPISLDDYEPFEAALSDFFTAADLLNLQMLDNDGIEARLATIDDNLRRSCRATAEAIAAVSLTGTITWPVQLEGGQLDDYVVTFGNTLTYVPGELWSDAEATFRGVFNDLQEMETKVVESGYGGSVEFWAGKKAYGVLLALAETYQDNPKAKLRVEVSQEGIKVGDYVVKKMVERYYDPKTKTMKPKVPDHKLMAFAKDALHTMFYCALDDLDGRLQALPYFSKPIDTKDPSGIKIVGRSKPFPVPIVKAICWAEVTQP